MKLPPRRLTLTQKEAIWAYVFISPWIIGFFIFTLSPMVASLYYSFTDFNIISEPIWRGFANYQKLLTADPLFWHSLKVTIKYAAMALPLNLVVGFGIAVLLNQKIPGVNVWRTMYFLPSVRGRGVGRRLLAHVLEAARAAGYRRCYLETYHTMDRARALYEAAGFKKLCEPEGATGHFGCDAWYAKDL